MAKVKLSALVSDISGRVAGTVFQRSGFGLTMRSQPGVRTPYNPLNPESRNGAMLVNQYWQSLTIPQRAAWDAYAQFRPRPTRKDSTTFMKGQQVFFMETHMRYMMYNYGSIFSTTLNPNPVFVPAPNILTVNAIVISGITMVLQHPQPVSTPSEAVILFLSAPMTASQASAHYKTKMIRFFTSSGTDQNCGAYYESVYGALPQVGDYLGYHIALYTDAAKSFSPYSSGIIQVTT